MSSIVQVRLVTGNKAVYRVQPQHVKDDGLCGSTLSRRAREYGQQLAHELNGQWFQPGCWKPVTDARVLALIAEAQEA